MFFARFFDFILQSFMDLTFYFLFSKNDRFNYFLETLGNALGYLCKVRCTIYSKIKNLPKKFTFQKTKSGKIESSNCIHSGINDYTKKMEKNGSCEISTKCQVEYQQTESARNTCTL